MVLLQSEQNHRNVYSEYPSSTNGAVYLKKGFHILWRISHYLGRGKNE